MPTNVDKLHDLNDKLEKHPEGWFWRRVGKTTLQIHQLSGQIHVGDDAKIIVQIKFWRDLDYLWHMISDIFREQGIEIVQYKQTLPDIMDVRYEGRNVRLYFFKYGESLNDEEEYRRMTRGFHCLEFNLIDY